MGFRGAATCTILVLFLMGATYLQGRSDGSRLEASNERAVRLQEAKENAIAINGIQTRYRAKEQGWQKSFASVSSDYQKDLIANGKALDLVIAGSRLFDRNANHKACGDSAATVTASASGRDGGSGAYLPAKTSEFLQRLASEADAVAIQLSACQGILLKERDP